MRVCTFLSRLYDRLTVGQWMLFDQVTGSLSWLWLAAGIGLVIGGATWGATKYYLSTTAQSRALDLQTMLASLASNSQSIVLPSTLSSGATNCTTGGAGQPVCKGFLLMQRPAGAPENGSADVWRAFEYVGSSLVESRCTGVCVNASGAMAGTWTPFTSLPLKAFSIEQIPISQAASDSDDPLASFVSALQTSVGYTAQDVSLKFGVPNACSGFCVTGSNAIYRVTGTTSAGTTFGFDLGVRSVAPHGQTVVSGSFAPTPPPSPSVSQRDFTFTWPGAPAQNFTISEQNYHDPFFVEEATSGNGCTGPLLNITGTDWQGTHAANYVPTGSTNGWTPSTTYVPSTMSAANDPPNGAAGNWTYPDPNPVPQPTPIVNTNYSSSWSVAPYNGYPGFCGNMGFFDTYTSRNAVPPVSGWAVVMGPLTNATGYGSGYSSLTNPGANELDLDIGQWGNLYVGKTYDSSSYGGGAIVLTPFPPATTACGGAGTGSVDRWGQSEVDVQSGTPSSLYTISAYQPHGGAAGCLTFIPGDQYGETTNTSTSPQVTVYVSSGTNVQIDDGGRTNGVSATCGSGTFDPMGSGTYVIPLQSGGRWQTCHVQAYRYYLGSKYAQYTAEASWVIGTWSSCQNDQANSAQIAANSTQSLNAGMSSPAAAYSNDWTISAKNASLDCRIWFHDANDPSDAGTTIEFTAEPTTSPSPSPTQSPSPTPSRPSPTPSPTSGTPVTWPPAVQYPLPGFKLTDASGGTCGYNQPIAYDGNGWATSDILTNAKDPWWGSGAELQTDSNGCLEDRWGTAIDMTTRQSAIVYESGGGTVGSGTFTETRSNGVACGNALQADSPAWNPSDNQPGPAGYMVQGVSPISHCSFSLTDGVAAPGPTNTVKAQVTAANCSTNSSGVYYVAVGASCTFPVVAGNLQQCVSGQNEGVKDTYKASFNMIGAPVMSFVNSGGTTVATLSPDVESSFNSGGMGVNGMFTFNRLASGTVTVYVLDHHEIQPFLSGTTRCSSGWFGAYSWGVPDPSYTFE
jgi:hypothetical protein